MLEMMGKPISVCGMKDVTLSFGPLDLRVRRRPGEWHFSAARGKDESRGYTVEEREPGGDLSWERWITGDEGNEILLRPVFPDRPLVVRPEMPVLLQPGHATDFYVGIPMSVEAATRSGGNWCRLCDFPSIKLSLTWFGSMEDGELCYSMRTFAHRNPEDLMPHENRCVCPVQVKNKSAEVLSFERFCLRCDYLNVYRGEKRLWSNAVRLSYRGRQEWSRIVYGTECPDAAGRNELVAAAKERQSSIFNFRSFQETGRSEVGT